MTTKSAQWWLCSAFVTFGFGCGFDAPSSPAPPAPVVQPSLRTLASTPAPMSISRPPEPRPQVVLRQAPLLLDARQAFERARPFTTVAIEHGVAVCQIGFRPRRTSQLGEVFDTFVDVATVGITAIARNSGEPDLVGIDLAIHARFGRGETWEAHAAWDAHRSYVSFPIPVLRPGDTAWLKLIDVDQVSADDVLGEWNLHFTGDSPLVATHGRAYVECRFLPREVVEQRVQTALDAAERAIAKMSRTNGAVAEHVATARDPLGLISADFDRAAVTADQQIALARGNTSDLRAWPRIADTERDFANATEPVVAARRERIRQGFESDANAPGVLVNTPCADAGDTLELDFFGAPAARRIRRAFAVDARGLVRPLRIRKLGANVRGGEPFATARYGDFDFTGRRSCAPPMAVVVDARRHRSLVLVNVRQ